MKSSFFLGFVPIFSSELIIAEEKDSENRIKLTIFHKNVTFFKVSFLEKRKS